MNLSDALTTALAGLRSAGVPTDLGHYAFCTNGSGSAGTLGIPTVGFGPGREDAAHTTDESITVHDLLTGARGYTALARALTSLTPGEIHATPIGAAELKGHD